MTMETKIDITGDEIRDDYYPPLLVFLGMMVPTVALWCGFIWAVSQIWS